MDYRYIRKDAWKYIVQVLKVEKVFCYFESKELPPNIIGISKVRYKGGKSSIKSFSDSIVYSLANKICPYTKGMSSPETSIDPNLYPNSKSMAPRKNLLKTDDPNVLILGKMSKYGSPYFEEEGCDELESETALYISRYLCNILKKKLGTSEYSKRICFLMLDFFHRTEYIRRHCTNQYYDDNGNVQFETFFEWEDMRFDYSTTGKHIIKYQTLVLKLLHDNFPNEFPLIQNGEKKQYTSILNKESEEYKKAKQEWDEYCEEQKRIEEEERKQEELENGWNAWDDWPSAEELNRDFWRECGEAGSNCESWPGWD
ncbi:MAG: hypothetical protein IJU90_07175 [Bacteroidales bacterium]|nr:hypothetical protein [Bacteroidales bacterium]